MKTKQEYLEIMSKDLDVSFLEDAPEKFVRQFYVDYELCKKLNFILTTFEKDYTVKRVNRNSKGEVSSVTVDKNWKITIDDIAFEGSYGSEIISESRFWDVEIYNTAYNDYQLGLLLDKFPEIKEEFLKTSKFAQKNVAFYEKSNII